MFKLSGSPIDALMEQMVERDGLRCLRSRFAATRVLQIKTTSA